MQLTDQKGSGGVPLVSELNEMHLVKLSNYKFIQGTVLIFRVSTTRFIGNVLKGFFGGVLGWFGVLLLLFTQVLYFWHKLPTVQPGNSILCLTMCYQLIVMVCLST